ncbi:transmembrane protein 241-like [Acanthaster planci]|uniref:Transmembrane protein 241-like n=1 Tax=Acanthaster planci TaxID=133434 RepID=A0A8B7YJI9_ACAPL|nr:transmembrane protein 241-like [Acanthaster planci]
MSFTWRAWCRCPVKSLPKLWRQGICMVFFLRHNSSNCMAAWSLIGVYCVLFVATNITNKYVLSVLHFTYPTLFQEWQTSVGVIVLFVAANRGFIKLTYDRSALLPWLPAMMFFVGSIYSGSRALSKLVVPAFVIIHNTVEFPAYIVGILINNQAFSLANIASMAAGTFAAILTWVTDPQRDEGSYEEGYFWMLIYVLSASSFAIYSTARGSAINLSDVEKLFYCYFFSAVALSPASVILGDIVAAREFPHWFLYRFYIGCILSGVLGAAMNLTGICVSRCPSPSLLSRLAIANAKTVLILVSLAIFEGMFTGDFALSVFLGVTAYSVYTVTKTTSNTLATNDVGEKLEIERHENT